MPPRVQFNSLYTLFSLISLMFSNLLVQGGKNSFLLTQLPPLFFQIRASCFRRLVGLIKSDVLLVRLCSERVSRYLELIFRRGSHNIVIALLCMLMWSSECCCGRPMRGQS